MGTLRPRDASGIRVSAMVAGLLCLSACATRLAGPAPAAAYIPEAAAAQIQSPQGFVQGFYDWYTRQAMNSQPGFSDAVSASTQWPMSEQIVNALRADQAVKESSPDNRVGMAFDPFFHTQDACYPYRTGKVTQTDGQTRVELFGVCKRAHPHTPDVIAAVEQVDGKWVFVDFIYPGAPGQADSDLLTRLKAPNAVAQLQSPQAFVQGFYDWYTQQAMNSEPGLTEAALTNTQWPMSDEIVTALKADEGAAEASPDEVVGIDFDPFLNTQESCYPYKTGKVTQANGRTRVELFGACERVHPQTPDVIAEIEPRDGKWVFVNFIYPGDPGQADSDLLTTLKTLSEERQSAEEHGNDE